MTKRCTHCGAAVPPARRSEDEDTIFCCSGCAAVYEAIHSSGLGDFYELQDPGAARPPEAGQSSRIPYDEFDSPAFQKRHASELESGAREIELQLEGVHCAGCVWLVERMPSRLDGVVDARLNLGRARLTVRWNPSDVDLSTIARWLERFGYSPHPAGEGAGTDVRRAEKTLLKRVGASWALAANVMLLAFALYAGLDEGAVAGLFDAFRWLSFGLATVAVLYGATPFFRRAWASVRPLVSEPGAFRATRLSIDIPISLGILGGYAHSAVATVRGTGEIWFDSVTVLIAALLTARWLQIRGQRTARDAADRLLSVIPTTARRVSESGLVSVATDKLTAGDIVEVRDGETIPVDGRVIEGSSSVQKSVLTGESRPERVEPGDLVFAGVTNRGESVRVRTSAAGESSRVGQLMEWIEDSSDSSAPIVQLADRLAGIFVLAVLGAGAATWVGWAIAGSPTALQHAIALLVISCPCALGMATPLAMTVGVGRAARRGIFVKDDGIFERLDRLGELIVDKTGTVTEGEMTVVGIDGSRDAVVMAAALEEESRHPVGRAIYEWCAEEARPTGAVAELEELAGRGLEGRVDGAPVAVGRPDWIFEKSVDRSGLEQTVRRMARAGNTPVAVSVDGVVEAVVALGDPIRPGAAEFIDEMRAADVRVTMLSGDHPEVVREVARQLDIPENAARGDVTPERKKEIVESRREELREAERPVVAMVGDGVNDAAALRAADVGIAVDGSANPSLVAADVFTTRHGIESLFELVAGSQNVLKAVRRNIGMSVLYNAAGISAAAAGLVTPLVAAVAMPISSIAVVLSSILQDSFESQGATTSTTTAACPLPPEPSDANPNPAPAE